MNSWEIKLVKTETELPEPFGYTKNLSDVRSPLVVDPEFKHLRSLKEKIVQ